MFSSSTKYIPEPYEGIEFKPVATRYEFYAFLSTLWETLPERERIAVYEELCEVFVENLKNGNLGGFTLTNLMKKFLEEEEKYDALNQS
jgi:hypothetical protein